jgi:hypothetical protein
MTLIMENIIINVLLNATPDLIKRNTYRCSKGKLRDEVSRDSDMTAALLFHSNNDRLNGRRPSGILKRHGAYLEEFSLFSLEIIHDGHLQILVDDLGTLLLARLELER